MIVKSNSSRTRIIGSPLYHAICSDFFTILSPLRAEIGIDMKFTSQFKVSKFFE